MTPELAQALNAFQAELVTVGKTASNPFFESSYADLSSIMQAAQPILTKHGLAVLQFPDHIDGRPALTTIVAHTSGATISFQAPLALTKDDPQSQGSAITYMRRYAYAAALQIVIDEDDDGNSASRPMTRSKPTAPSDDHWTAPEPQVGTVGTPSDGATSNQIGLIQILLGKAGYKGDARYDRLSIILDKSIHSSRELSKREASLVIEALQVEVGDK